MKHKSLVKLAKSVLVCTLSAAMVFSSNMGTLTAQAASSPEELEPILFTIDNVVGTPGESVKVNINASLGSGFSGAMGEIETSDGISVSKVSRGEFGGTMMYSKTANNLLYLTSDGCNVYGDGIFGKLLVDVSSDAEPGIYSIDWVTPDISYAYEDLSGQTIYPAKKVKVSAGSVTVPMTYTKDYVFLVESKEIKAGETDEVGIIIKNPIGFYSVEAEFEAEGGIEVCGLSSDKGLSKFTASENRGIVIGNDGKNITSEGSFAKLSVKVPEGTPAGDYDITMNVKKLSYAYSNGSGYESVPEEYIKTVVGTITVASDSEVPEFGRYAFLVGTTEVEAGEIAHLTIDVKNSTGFNAFNATFDADSSLLLAGLTSDIGLTKFNKKEKTGFFVTKDTKNMTNGGKIVALDVVVPAGTPAGEYVVSMDITALKYKVNDGTDIEIPLENVLTIAGKIIVKETQVPTEEPTQVPTEEPTQVPTEEPTQVPTEEPTQVPTEETTQVPTEEPTQVPTEEPTQVPTEEPTQVSTEEPTQVPTEEPTQVPTEEPTQVPTEEPTEEPTQVPTEEPVVDVKDLTVTTNVNNWGSGYQVQIKVANETGNTVDGWSLKINKNDIDIDASWSVSITEEGNYYVITPVEWNKTLAAGASTEFGIQGSGHIADKIEILVNGKAVEEPTQEPTQEPTTEEPTQEPTTEEPTQEPTTEEPTQEPTTEEPSTEEPSTEEPIIDPVVDVVTLSDVSFGKAVDLTPYNYKDIKKIVVKLTGLSDQYSGAVVLGEWNQQVSFEKATVIDNKVTVEVTSPQSVLSVYKWWSSTTLEIESIDLIY